jgi:hypothetical protein
MTDSGTGTNGSSSLGARIHLYWFFLNASVSWFFPGTLRLQEGTTETDFKTMTRLTKQEEQLQLKHEMDDFEVIELHSFVNSSVRLPLSSSLCFGSCCCCFRRSCMRRRALAVDHNRQRERSL